MRPKPIKREKNNNETERNDGFLAWINAAAIQTSATIPPKLTPLRLIPIYHHLRYCCKHHLFVLVTADASEDKFYLPLRVEMDKNGYTRKSTAMNIVTSQEKVNAKFSAPPASLVYSNNSANFAPLY